MNQQVIDDAKKDVEALKQKMAQPQAHAPHGAAAAPGATPWLDFLKEAVAILDKLLNGLSAKP